MTNTDLKDRSNSRSFSSFSVSSLRTGQEWACVALALTFFLLLNVLTADRYPYPFGDEVILTDPAVNYLTGYGFTSPARVENPPIFYFGNVPAHSALLIPWLKVFGISMRAVRSINFVYMAMAIALIWSAAKRTGLVPSISLRLLLVSMLMCDYSIILAYRSGRYDCLGMLVVAFAFWSFSTRSTPLRLVSLGFAGAASPWVGLQLLPMEAVLGVTLFAFFRFRYGREISAVFAGSLIGGIGLIRFFISQGVLKYFLGFLDSQSKGAGFIAGLLQGRFRHSNVLPKDFSLPLLLACAVLLAVTLSRGRGLHLNSPLIYGLVFVPLLGLTLLLAAKFPTYYGWMTYVPLAICVCGSLDLQLPAEVRRVGIGLCVAASAVGVGLHVLACAGDWKDRDVSRLQSFLASNIRANDRVFVDPQAYYPAKLSGAATFFWDAGSRRVPLSAVQKSHLTVCVIDPANRRVLQELGGAWYGTGQQMIPSHTGLFGRDNQWGFLSLPNYRLSVYRRVPAS